MTVLGPGVSRRPAESLGEVRQELGVRSRCPRQARPLLRGEERAACRAYPLREVWTRGHASTEAIEHDFRVEQPREARAWERCEHANGARARDDRAEGRGSDLAPGRQDEVALADEGVTRSLDEGGLEPNHPIEAHEDPTKEAAAKASASGGDLLAHEVGHTLLGVQASAKDVGDDAASGCSIEEHQRHFIPPQPDR
jgi:hypothetical protein